jgi:protein phosphatase
VTLQLRFAAISDVGRVRKDNQDSGYAGPWLLAVCDGVGGAARGDLASSTAVQQLRNIDAPPVPEHTAEEMVAQVAGALHRAHDRIAELVDHDPDLSSTSTTATVGLFDGEQLAIGHVGDSRAYLFRDQGLTQLTHDHTFVQTLIDDGRIADVLAGGSPDYAAVELVRASLEAGSSDNVTCIVADVVEAGGPEDDVDATEPQLVGAAAELRRRRLFRGHRSGDTGELEPVAVDGDGPGSDLDSVPAGAIPDDPLDPDLREALRYAPRAPRRFVWLRRVLALVVIVGLVWVAAAAAWSWAQGQYFVGVDGDGVTIFRGLNTSFAGIDLSTPYLRTDVDVDDLATYDAGRVRQGVTQSDLDDARRYVDNLVSRIGTVAGAE